MSDSEKYITTTVGEELAVKSKELSGDIVSAASEKYVTTVVETEQGKELALKVKILEGGGGGGGYTLPTATATRLGGIKVGQNLSVEADGTLNAQAVNPYILPAATSETLGGVKIGSGLSVTEDGTVSTTGGEVPDNVYTEDNLLAGQAVSLSNSGLYNTEATGGAPDRWVIANDVYNLNGAGAWEIQIKIDFVEKSSGTSAIIGFSSSTHAKFPCLFVNHSGGVNNLYWLLSSNGSYWNMGEGNVGAQLLDGETYYIKYGFTGTEYYCCVGTVDFDTATRYTLLTSSTHVYSTDKMVLLQANTVNPGDLYNNGTVYLGETKIIMDNVVVFNGQDIDKWTNHGCVLQQTEIAATKKINFDPTVITGYNASQKQRLVNDNGTLKWEAVS